MKEFRGGIIRLFEQGKSGYQIAKDMKLPYTTVRDTIRRYRETGNYNDRPRSGRPRTARTPAKIRKFKDRIQRNPNSQRNSTRKMAKGVGIGRSSVLRILHDGMKARMMVKSHTLMPKVAILKINS